MKSLRFGDAEVLVAVVGVQGSPGDRLIRDKAADALEAAQDTIENVARSAVRTIESLKATGHAPASVEVDLGLAFTVEGNVVLAGGSIGASVSIRLHYDTTPILS